MILHRRQVYQQIPVCRLIQVLMVKTMIHLMIAMMKVPLLRVQASDILFNASYLIKCYSQLVAVISKKKVGVFFFIFPGIFKKGWSVFFDISMENSVYCTACTLDQYNAP